MTDADVVFHRLRYFLIAAVIAFLTLAVLVMFNYQQSLRNYDGPERNAHIICTALIEILIEVDVDQSIDIPGECTPEVLAAHRNHEDD